MRLTITNRATRQIHGVLGLVGQMYAAILCLREFDRGTDSFDRDSV